MQRPVIQHSIRRPMYSGAQINTAIQRMANDITNIELESATETGVRNIRKSTLKCNRRLRLKKILRHENCSNKDAKQELDIQHIPDESASISYQRDNSEDEPEIPEKDSFIEMSNINVGNDIIATGIYQKNLEIGIENLENNLENFILKFEASGNNSNCFGEKIKSPENKSEIDEETEQELQGNEDLNFGYDNEQTIEYAQISQANDETSSSKPNDNKIEILENIIIKHASKTNDEILTTISDNIIVLKKGNSTSKVDIIENVTAQEINSVNNSNFNEQINDVKNKILEANNENVLKQTNSNAKVEEIQNIDPKNNEPTTEMDTSTKTRHPEIIDLNKSYNESTEKAPQFDDFKVPKEVTHSKKKVVKKQQSRFVLTHVVGGYIIQESNFAFPIREPQSQKNKPQSSNTKLTAPPIEVIQEKKVIEQESGTKEPAATEVNEEVAVVKEEFVTEELVPPTEMKEEDIKYIKEDVANGEFNPFARLQQSTVKSWTVEDLSNHLLKCNWEETASLLQDNEIDGASLFMVTKTQLMIVGVNEEQADVISEFVQSGPSKGN